MSKVAKKLKTVAKKVGEKVNHGTKLSTYIPAGLAAAAPPIGPQLGQKGINIAAFCKDFNEKTKDYKEGIPVPCRVTVNPDRTYNLTIHHPPTSYFLKQAAGIQRGSMIPRKEHAGIITVKHVYEIAKIKQEDPPLRLLSLENVCKMVMREAMAAGIKVVHKLDPKEYGEFLEERKVIVEQQLKELKEKKEAKMLRTG
nr:EOG090X0I63 [Sida crystallina]